MTSLMLVSHGQVGQALLDAAIDILGQNPMPTLILAVSPDDSPETICERGLALLRQRPEDEPILVLTDMLGSTPCNVAAKLKAGKGFQVVAGLNLPMLLHVLNHADSDLDSLANGALETGRRGVLTGRPQSHAPNNQDTIGNHSAVL